MSAPAAPRPASSIGDVLDSWAAAWLAERVTPATRVVLLGLTPEPQR